MVKTKRMTQAERVLGQFKYWKNYWLSGLHFTRLGRPILCYTKRLSELRAAGHNIEKRWNHKGYWEYRLRP